MQLAETCVVIIPCLNEAATIHSVVTAVKLQLRNVIVVDDGSQDATAELAANAGAEVIRHQKSRGKGASLNTGWQRATERGFTWALCLDGDGQHAVDDVPLFLAAARDDVQLVVGNRFENPGHMPWLRRCVNQWMSRRLSLIAGITLPDSQCGFRLMNLGAWSTLSLRADHFEIESEVLLAFVARGYAVKFVPVRTIYADESSKINPVRDTWRWLRWWRRAQALKRG